MVRSWSYLVVVLCVTVTSSRVLHRHGDELRSQGNHPSDVRLEKLTTPPTGNGLIIDYDGCRGNSNGTRAQGSSGTRLL